MTPHTRTALTPTVLTLAMLGLVACGEPEARPPNHPTVAMKDRQVSRIQVVELVIADDGRARRVKQLLLDMEKLFQRFERERAAEARKLAELSARREYPEADVRAAMQRIRGVGKRAYPAYVALQLELRKHTTPEEFARLDEVR